MFLGILVLITALTISSVAIYYSVAGLVAIFAAASIPIMIMGASLEIGKLVTAVWLHRYWKQAAWWLKTYLSISVVVLMFITSMGIFGFLSKAHIEQTAGAQESVAQVERLIKEIAGQEAAVSRADDRIVQLESTGTGSDANVQLQIDKEQDRIDSAYSRIQPAIEEQQLIIDSQAQLYKDELAKIDTALAQLQSYIDAGSKDDIKKAQAMVGAKADGAFGPKTAELFRNWQTEQQIKRNEILSKIESATNNPQAQAARNEILRLRSLAETQIDDSNKLIARLREKVGNTNKDVIDQQIEEQRSKITKANNTIDTLTEQKYTLEAEYRKLEAEVGPVKYLAEFIYGETANQDLLESAVRWVIIVIIFVFDPLAVLLLIASQYTFKFRKENKERLKAEQERKNYEQARAQRMVENPGWPIKETKDEITNRPTDEQSNNNSGTDSGTDENTTTDTGGETLQANNTTPSGELAGTEDLGRHTTTGVKELHFHLTPEQQERAARYTELDSNENIKNSKQQWKEENPDLTIKEQKDLYIHGKIDELPWEGYKQNQEQSEKSIWSMIQKRK
jgi:hypothetical protein